MPDAPANPSKVYFQQLAAFSTLEELVQTSIHILNSIMLLLFAVDLEAQTKNVDLATVEIKRWRGTSGG